MPENRDLFDLAKSLKRADVLRRKYNRDAVKTALGQVADIAIEKIPSKGIGRKIWGKKSSGLKKLVRVVEVKEEAENYQAAIDVVGLAGLVEQGGATKRHEIRSKGRPLARRAGENKGRVFFVKPARFVGPIQKKRRRPKNLIGVEHPGGPVEAQHRVIEALEGNREQVKDYLVKVLDRSFAEAANG